MSADEDRVTELLDRIEELERERDIARCDVAYLLGRMVGDISHEFITRNQNAWLDVLARPTEVTP